MLSKHKLFELFETSVKALKDAFPKYKHLLFSTGLEDNVNYDMNDETSFKLDSNLAEFTDYAMRLSIIQYLYNYPTLNFDLKLLETELNIFTFSNGIFQKSLLKSIKKSIELNVDFFFPFLPVSESSHWYTLCVSPSCNKIIIINPLNNSNENELNYLHNIMQILCKKINIEYEINFENAGIQTSGKSCGESTLLIFFSLLHNNATGYKNLVQHLHKDLPIRNIFELCNVANGNFCDCNKCIDENIPFNIIKIFYIGCKKCKKYNIYDAKECSYCKSIFTNDNSVSFHTKTSKNRQQMENQIRLNLLEAVEKCDPDKVCKKSYVKK